MTTPVSTTGAKPVSFTDYIWGKCKSQPLIPIGIVATCFALGGATWNLRTGNRQRFNHYLRLRVIAQGATVVAMVAYGSVAITREQQQAHYIKTQKTLGDLPADTVVPQASSRIGQATPDFDEARRTAHAAAVAASASGQTMQDTAPDSSTETDTVSYPLAKKDRMRASDFAKRLREAEKMTAKEDEEKAKRG